MLERLSIRCKGASHIYQFCTQCVVEIDEGYVARTGSLPVVEDLFVVLLVRTQVVVLILVVRPVQRLLLVSLSPVPPRIVVVIVRGAVSI